METYMFLSELALSIGCCTLHTKCPLLPRWKVLLRLRATLVWPDGVREPVHCKLWVDFRCTEFCLRSVRKCDYNEGKTIWSLLSSFYQVAESLPAVFTILCHLLRSKTILYAFYRDPLPLCLISLLQLVGGLPLRLDPSIVHWKMRFSKPFLQVAWP